MLSERAVLIWGTPPTPVAQFATHCPRDEERLVRNGRASSHTAVLGLESNLLHCPHYLCSFGEESLVSVLNKNILFILFSLVKINDVTKLFTFEPFSPFRILALLRSLFPFPVSFIRKQEFASY